MHRLSMYMQASADLVSPIATLLLAHQSISPCIPISKASQPRTLHHMSMRLCSHPPFCLVVGKFSALRVLAAGSCSKTMTPHTGLQLLWCSNGMASKLPVSISWQIGHPAHQIST